MRLNDLGQLLSAVGDGIVAIDGTVVGRGGAAQWEYRDGRSVLYNGHDPADGAWKLLRYMVATKATDVVLVNGQPVLDGEFLAVSEGRFAVMTKSGLVANFPFSPGSVMSLVGTDGRGAAGFAGEIALCDDQSCRSFTIYAADGHEEHVAGIAYGLWIIDATRAIWSAGAHGYALKTAVPLSAPKRVALDDGDWIVGWADGVGLVAQLNGSEHKDGYILASDGTQFDYDAHRIAGELVIAWSTSTAEAPGQDRKVTVDRTRPRIPIAPPLPTPAFAFSHPVLICPFKDPNGATSAPAEIVVNQTGQKAARPYFVAEDSLGGPFIGSRLGVYSEAADPSSAIALAACLQTRLLLAHDAPAAWVVPTGLLRPWDVPALELYLVVGETVAQSIDRWTRELVALLEAWPGDVGLIVMFYCGGGAPPNETFTVAQVLAGLAALSDLVNRSPRIKVIAPFEYLRANGIIGHPELATAFAALLVAAGKAGLATLTPISSSPAPVPHPPAPTPKPQPAPTPAPVPSTPFPAARPLGGSMRAFVKIDSYYTGINPTAQTKDAHGHPLTGDAQWPVYYNRPGEPNAGGPWETVELTPHDGGQFDVLYVAANRQLSVDQFGNLQSRAAGAIGPDELFYATTQPDGANFLYRFQNGVLVRVGVLTLEAA